MGKLFLRLLLLLVAFPCFGADVVFTNANFQSGREGLKYIEAFSLDAPILTLSNTIVRDRQRFTNDANGYWVITNYYPGFYRIEFHGKYTITTNWYEFPSTNATINGNDPTYWRGPTNAPNVVPITVGDNRWIRTQGLTQATNDPAGTKVLGTPDGAHLAWMTVAAASFDGNTNQFDVGFDGKTTVKNGNRQTNTIFRAGTTFANPGWTLEGQSGGPGLLASFFSGQPTLSNSVTREKLQFNDGLQLMKPDSSVVTITEAASTGTINASNVTANLLVSDGSGEGELDLLGTSGRIYAISPLRIDVSNGAQTNTLTLRNNANGMTWTTDATIEGGLTVGTLVGSTVVTASGNRVITLGTNINGGGVGGSIILDNALNNDNYIGWRALYLGNAVHAAWFLNTNHSGSPFNLELQGFCLGDMSLNFGYGDLGGRCQAGPTGYPGSDFVFQYSQPLSVSEMATWTSTDTGLANQYYAGIRAVGSDTTGFIELRCYNPRPTFTPGTHTTAWNDDGRLQFKVMTNGMSIRGQIINERAVSSSSASTLALNFAGARLQDISVSGTAVTLSTTGATAGTTNVHRTTFYLRGAASTTLTFPIGATGWNTNFNGSLPTSVQAGQIVRLELEATGIGETNVQLIDCQLFNDNSFAWDADALSFFTRASITDPIQKAAVNTLVISLKAGGTGTTYWTGADAIYPFVGGAATPHSKNLKQNLYNITFNGTVTHDANGITGNAVDGYGDTGFNPSSASSPNYVQNSACLFVYGGTTTPTDSGFFAGGQSTAMMGMFRSGANLSSRAANCACVGTMIVSASTDFRGPMFVQRTASGSQAIGVRSTYTTDTTASSGIPNANLYVLAYDNGGAAGTYTSANIRFMYIGAKLGNGSQADADAFRTIIETYETTLSRNAP